MTEIDPFDDERLSAYLDDELSRDEREQFEQFIKDRPDYRQAMDELQTMRSRLKALPTAALGNDFADRVLRKAETATLIGDRQTDKATQATVPADRSTWTRARILTIAGALAASLLALLILPSQLSKQPSVAMAPSGDPAGEPAAELRFESSSSAANETIQPASLPHDEADFSSEADSVTAAAEAAAQPFDDDVPAAVTTDMMFLEDREGPGTAGAGAGYSDTPDRSAAGGIVFASIEDREYQLLASQAHELFQTLEPEANAGDGWDIVLTTELRSAQDWSGLKAALAANSIQLVPPPAVASANFARTASESDEEMVNSEDGLIDSDSNQTIRQDSEIFNQKLQLPLAAAPTVGKNRRRTVGTAIRKQDSEAVPTHLLYVEGTRSQLSQLVDELSVSQSNQILEVVQDQAVQKTPMRQQTKNVPPQQKFSKGNSISPGRAIHLGQSPLKRTATQKAQQDRQPMRAARSSPLRNTLPVEEAKDQTLMRGLIILQDVSEPLTDEDNETPNDEAANESSDAAE
jgi:hypothetical protein